jgi:hypothetical protein
MIDAIQIVERRERYRPMTPAGRAPAILDLYRAGLRVRDISAAVEVPLSEVLEAVRGEGSPCE